MYIYLQYWKYTKDIGTTVYIPEFKTFDSWVYVYWGKSLLISTFFFFLFFSIKLRSPIGVSIFFFHVHFILFFSLNTYEGIKEQRRIFLSIVSIVVRYAKENNTGEYSPRFPSRYAIFRHD